MEALEFARIQRRMCAMYGECHGCPMEFEYCRIAMGSAENDEEIISIVEAWGKEHPVKTRQSEFLKLFPHASKCDYDSGQLDICPKKLDADFKCRFEDGLDCYECERIYWSEEIE